MVMLRRVELERVTEIMLGFGIGEREPGILLYKPKARGHAQDYAAETVAMLNGRDEIVDSPVSSE